MWYGDDIGSGVPLTTAVPLQTNSIVISSLFVLSNCFFSGSKFLTKGSDALGVLNLSVLQAQPSSLADEASVIFKESAVLNIKALHHCVLIIFVTEHPNYDYLQNRYLIGAFPVSLVSSHSAEHSIAVHGKNTAKLIDGICFMVWVYSVLRNCE